ncbi:Tat pathway signal protein [Longispora urticae]
MPRPPKEPNTALRAAITDTGLTYEAFAAAVRRIAVENGEALPALGRTHVAHWIAGVRPSGRAPQFIAEAISRRTHRRVTVAEIGLTTAKGAAEGELGLDWSGDVVTDLVTLGRADMDRRNFQLNALYSLTSLVLPLDRWQEIADRGRTARAAGGSGRVGMGEVEAVRDMVAASRSADEKFGGGHARTAVVEYLTSDVAAYLNGTFTADDDRKAMFTAAAELAFLVGWKAFDTSQHGMALHYYNIGLRLANEADDRALAGYILRAMAHQAVDLGHGQLCLNLADSSLQWSAHHSTPGAHALFTVLRARGQAATGDSKATAVTLGEAERLLSKAAADAEPGWIRFMDFGESSLASQAGQALRDLGDHRAAEDQFRRSIQLRDAAKYRRIHSLTLANMADAQARQGNLGEACHNWNSALDLMTDIRSARAHKAIATVRSTLGSLGTNLPAAGRTLQRRVTEELRQRTSV